MLGKRPRNNKLAHTCWNSTFDENRTRYFTFGAALSRNEQIMSLAKQYFEKGKRLLAENKRAEALTVLNDAKKNS